MHRNKVKGMIADSVVLVGFLLMIASLLMFLIMNEGVFFSTVGLGIIFLIILALLPIGYSIVVSKTRVDNRSHRIRAVMALALAAIIFLVCILFSLVIDFVQPLVLNTTTNILMIVAGGLLLLGALLELLFDNSRISMVVSGVLVLLMLTGIIWANTEGYKPFNDKVIASKVQVFKNGDSGYATFRLPSIVPLDKNVLNEKKGLHLEHDLLLATAEGRKRSSHDTGSIDMVGKISKDGGKTWGKLQVLLSYKNEVGKFGNPTPVLDRNTGDLIFPYMTGLEKTDYDYSTFVAKFTFDSEANLVVSPRSEHIDISFKKGNEDNTTSDGVRSYTLMVGPGKSIQVKRGAHAGRLIIPASGKKHSFVMYSDDGGTTWKKGGSAGLGNECEVVEIGTTGELCMVVRDNTGCCDNHFKQYQRLSYSSDGGETWHTKTVNTSLRSPICMSSVAMVGDTMLLTYPDSFYTRVNLSIATSKDSGKHFKVVPLYEGPTGYSCVSVDSEDNIFVLAEIGKVNYNEELILLKLDKSKLI